MSRTETPTPRKSAARKNDLHDARPLLQAILLGIVLASVLVAAAVMANPSQSKAAYQPGQPAVEAPVHVKASGRSANSLM